MKKTILTLMGMLLAVSASAFTIVVRQADGMRTYDSAEVSSIVMQSDGNVTVNVGDQQITIPAADFSSLDIDDFTWEAPTLATERKISIRASRLLIDGEEGEMMVYTHDGRLAARGLCSEGIDVSALSGGIYIVKSANVQSKIYVK